MSNASRTNPADRLADAHPIGIEKIRELTNRVRGEVRLGAHDRMLYSTDASIYQVEPMGVVIPVDLDDAAAALKACDDLGLPVLPRGGGTSLAGQCVNDAIVIDISAACRGIASVDRETQTCQAEAGVTIGQLNEHLKIDGLFFAPDPATATHATIGGCIGNNAAGSRSVKYGRTSENLLGVEVCLADGRRVNLERGAGGRDPSALDLASQVIDVCARHAVLIRERFPKTARRNAGYALDMILAQMDEGATAESIDLTPLMCGAEGTLAFTLSARLKLEQIPSASGLAVVTFQSVDKAIAAVLSLLKLNPSAIELLDSLILKLARENLDQRRNVELFPGGADADALLYVEFQSSREPGAAARQIAENLRRVRAMFAEDRSCLITDKHSMNKAWELRKAGEPLLHGISGSRKPIGFIEDAAVPPERLSEYVARLREIIEREGTIASYYAHASVGVLHVRPLLDLCTQNDRAAMERIAIGSAELAKELGGVMSGEHGDGRARGPLLKKYFGPELMGAFREIKAIFDPRNRLNPGNIVEPGTIETIHQTTRLSNERADARPADTYFDFSDQGGLMHAASLCNGAGVCRKTSGGTMCPSYRATRDERHTTRGRGNALRLAITGQFSDGVPAWNDAETMATLDLCLSCKACKNECPSNVDIGKMKAEFAAQGFRAGRSISLQSRVLGNIHTLNRLAGIFPNMSNLGMNLTRPIANSLLGLHPARSLPKFEKPLHKHWPNHTALTRNPLPETPPRVILYADTFTTHSEPGVGLAAKRVLEAFGYRVDLYRGSDAGRALLSVGLLPAATRRADEETEQLLPLLDKAEAVLFLEPSCHSAVIDDWVSLRRQTPEDDRKTLAARAFMVEQFLAGNWDKHPRRPGFNASAGTVLLHAHCHQKALLGASSSADFLERCFPGKVRTLDTTCCGLAGGFGFARGRYDLSMQIGELGLLPAAREAAIDDVIAAPGTSCRHQIKDGAGKRAFHPIELAADHLKPGF